MKKIEQTNILIANEALTGLEPIFNNSDLETQKEELNRGFNFYKHYMDHKAMVKPVAAWMKSVGYAKKDIATIKTNITKINSAIIALILMYNRGLPTKLDESIPGFDVNAYYQMVRTELNRVLQLKSKKSSTEPKISPWDRTVEKVQKNIMVPLGEVLDNMILDPKYKTDINLYSILQEHSIARNGLKIITEWVERQKSEVVEALEGTCPDSVEGYSHLNKSSKKRMITNFDYLLDQVEKYRLTLVKKKKGKTRQKKSIPVAKKINRFKYKESDSDYGISSVKPQNIIGSREALIFNTKYKTLTHLVSDSQSGFDIKGTTILNVNLKAGITKRLRKPESVLTDVQKNRQFRKTIDGLSTKGKIPTNSRTNANDVIIRVL